MPADVNACRLWMYGGDLQESYSSFTVFRLLLWPHHVDDKGVVGSIEATDADPGCKENRQNEVEVGDEGDKEEKCSRHKETGAKESKFLPRYLRVVAKQEKSVKRRTYQQIHLMMKLARTAAKQLPIALPVQMKLIWWFGTPT